MKILLADDNRSIVYFNKLMLERNGHDVLSCHTEAEVDEVLSKGEGFTVAFVDYLLGDASSLPLARRIRLHMPEAKIVVLTGAASQTELGEIDGCIKEGLVQGLIKKPFGLKELLESIGS